MLTAAGCLPGYSEALALLCLKLLPLSHLPGAAVNKEAESKTDTDKYQKDQE